MKRLASILAALLASTAAHATDLYAYVGNTPAKDIVPLENMIDRKVDGLVMFNDYTQTPEIALYNSYGVQYLPKGYKLAFSVPLAFYKGSTGKLHPGAHTMADVGAGKLDDYYTGIGYALVHQGQPTADVRLGWEENGGWYQWTAPGHEADWHAAFVRASAAIRSTCPHCTIWWNPGDGGDPSKDVPAAGSYDGVAWDVYANDYGPPPTEPGMWARSLYGYWGIDSIGTWPSSSQPIAIPEFGVGSRGDGHGAPDAANKTNGGDDGLFMFNALTYFVVHHAKFVGYWDFNAGDYNSRISDGSRPYEALAFLQVFGAGSLPTYLRGATIYSGPIHATTPGLYQITVQLANGRVAVLAWGPTLGPVTFDSVVEGPAKTETLFHPLTGVTYRSWAASGGMRGFVYKGGLVVIELQP